MQQMVGVETKQRKGLLRADGRVEVYNIDESVVGVEGEVEVMGELGMLDIP